MFCENSEDEKEEKIGQNIIKDTNGCLRWMYEFSLWKNPAVLLTTYKILLISSFFPALLMFFLTFEDGIIDAFKVLFSVMFFVAAALTVLLAVAYVVLGLFYGGKYYVLFKMDEKGVNHIQLNKQYKKAQALGFLTAIASYAAGNVSLAGAGLMGASKQSHYTSFNKVKSIKVYSRRNTIYINESLKHNQIYADKKDFQFVKEYILKCCPKNARITEK